MLMHVSRRKMGRTKYRIETRGAHTLDADTRGRMVWGSGHGNLLLVVGWGKRGMGVGENEEVWRKKGVCLKENRGVWRKNL